VGSTPVQIGQRESDFSNPLGLLGDCHRRIERFLGVLLTIAESGDGGELDPARAASLKAALDYFRNAAPKHTADEEESLFPRMRAAGALAGLNDLESDHQVADAAHREVDALGRHWLELGRLPEEQAQRMTRLLRLLAEMYARHIAVEDNEIFPEAARVLGAEELAEVGREMKTRRIPVQTER
jgi:hemerythrin-like domain-containing protein